MSIQARESSPPTQSGPHNRRPPVQVAALRDLRTGAEIPLPGERRYVLGKGASCDIVVPDPCVSRIHCVLERQGGALFVRDSGSRNGTYLNRRRIVCGEVTPGTILAIGDTQLLALGPAGQLRAGFDRLIGADPSLTAALELARKAAASDCSVLILGETGTGKELVAQAIHGASRRVDGPFVPLNCGAIPHELIGSELFGHERGAFTGATGERDGVFLQAHGGTLFLDEIGELPMAQQPHLLRALESRRVRRVGGAQEQAFDARIIAATNREAGLGSERGALRIDLLHRIATVLVRLPPLRSRPGDLDLLCGAMLEELGREHGPRRLSAAARRALREHTWPGNVRELRQALTRAATLSLDVIEPAHLFPTAWGRAADGGPTPTPPSGAAIPVDGAPLTRYDAIVREAMRDALDRHGSIRGAADALGMAKSTFADRAKRLGLTVTGRRR